MIPVLATSRAWAWPVLLAVVGGAVLLGRVVAAALDAAPGSREAYRAAWRRSWRPIGTTGVALAWTLVYTLYALSLPTLGPLLRVDLPGLAAPAGAGSDAAPATSAPAPSGIGFGDGGTGLGSGPSPSSPASPTSVPRPESPPAPACSAAAVGDAVTQVQAAVEQLTGRPLGADLSLVVEALAGCGDAENAALSLLGPINQLLNELGLPLVPLPATPDLPVPRVPEAIAAPLRPTVFDTCGQVMPQLLTVAAVAPIARISADDAIRVLRYVSAICGAFAPEPT